MAIKKKHISPRQKMINLMYVVLMAMLALNISSEVLNGFSIVEESLNRTTANSSKENEVLYGNFAEQMKKNAYRAVTPVLISLAVMIAIVLMLSYFMNLYCVDPVLKMNKGLGDYLAYRVPFVAKGDFKDEMLQLKEKIDALIALSKQQKN